MGCNVMLTGSVVVAPPAGPSGMKITPEVVRTVKQSLLQLTQRSLREHTNVLGYLSVLLDELCIRNSNSIN